MSVMAFPWEQMGVLLRKLSLAGTAGNVAAWALFLGIGACPCICWGVLARRRISCRTDLLLPVLSLTLFAGLWFMINPSYLEAYLFPAGMAEMGKCAFAAAIDSVLFSWLLLRFLRSCGDRRGKRLLWGLELCLGLYIALTAVAALCQGGAELAAGWEAIGSNANAAGPEWMSGGNPGRLGGRSVGLSRVVLVLQISGSYLPTALELAIGGAAIGFLRSCEQGSFQEKSLGQVRRLKRLSCRFLGVILGYHMCVNLLQLALARYLYSSHYTLVFPFRAAILMLGTVLLSEFWLEGKKLQEDNQMFI